MWCARRIRTRALLRPSNLHPSKLGSSVDASASCSAELTRFPCWQLIEGALGPGCHIYLNVHASFKEDNKEPQYWAAKFLRVGAPFKGTLSLTAVRPTLTMYLISLCAYLHVQL